MNKLLVNGNIVRDMEVKDTGKCLVGTFTIANNVTTVDISEEEYDMVAEAVGGEPPMVTGNVDDENADDDAVGYFGLHAERVTCDELDELEGVDPSIIEKFKQAIEEFVSNNLESLV